MGHLLFFSDSGVHPCVLLSNVLFIFGNITFWYSILLSVSVIIIWHPCGIGVYYHKLIIHSFNNNNNNNNFVVGCHYCLPTLLKILIFVFYTPYQMNWDQCSKYSIIFCCQQDCIIWFWNLSSSHYNSSFIGVVALYHIIKSISSQVISL